MSAWQHIDEIREDVAGWINGSFKFFLLSPTEQNRSGSEFFTIQPISNSLLRFFVIVWTSANRLKVYGLNGMRSLDLLTDYSVDELQDILSDYIDPYQYGRKIVRYPHGPPILPESELSGATLSHLVEDLNKAIPAWVAKVEKGGVSVGPRWNLLKVTSVSFVGHETVAVSSAYDLSWYKCFNVIDPRSFDLVVECVQSIYEQFKRTYGK